MDMRHLDHLEDVARADVATVRRKEQTYQGSWKKSGGRSAWFMIKRKMDRLTSILARPETPGFANQDNVEDSIRRIRGDAASPASVEGTVKVVEELWRAFNAEDIFALIELDPSGKDGSALAEVRDLRQYLMLVEAEMRARAAGPGLVVGPDRVLDLSRDDLADVVEAALAQEASDLYDQAAEVLGVPRGAVKEALIRLKYGELPDGPPPRPDAGGFQDGQGRSVRVGDPVRSTLAEGPLSGLRGTLEEALQDGDAVVRDEAGTLHSIGWNHLEMDEPLAFRDHYGRIIRIGDPVRVARGKLMPPMRGTLTALNPETGKWVVSIEGADIPVTARAEEIVLDRRAREQPGTPEDGGHHELESNVLLVFQAVQTRLRAEVNHHERSQLPEQVRDWYDWDQNQSKYRLREPYATWLRDAEQG